MIRPAALAIVLFSAVFILAGCTSDAEAPSPGSPTVAPNIQPTLPPSTQNVCLANPSPASNTNQPAQFGYRIVTAPAANATVQSPLNVIGQANPFEGAYSVTVYNAAGNQIAGQNYNKDNLILQFTAALPFTVTSPTPACVWVHERSGNNGAPINITQIPVTLSP